MLKIFKLEPVGPTLPSPVYVVLELPLVPGNFQDVPIFSTQAGAELCVAIGRHIDDATIQEIEIFTSRGGNGLAEFRKWRGRISA